MRKIKNKKQVDKKKQNKTIMKNEKVKTEKGITILVLVITIIVLLILAGITISAITSDNGIIQNAGRAKEETEITNEKEVLEKATVQAMGNNKYGNIVKDELQNALDKETGEGKTETSEIGEEIEVVFIESDRYYTVDRDGNVTQIITEENVAETPVYWEKTSKTDEEWYSYADISNGDKEVKVNEPKLRGAMTAIKYVGEDAESQTGSKWANAITQDGSMWVWIPRYAYKITSGYHQSGTDTTRGTIEVAFIDINNQFLNGETGTIVTEPSEVTYTEDGNGEQVQNEWLVHPAFTSNAENGGGFGELTGIWVGKFETTGSYDSTTGERIIMILPGIIGDLSSMTVNEQYQLAKSATFEENVTINSHMAKNSEWGAIAYLTQSKYGINGKELKATGNTSVAGTGGTSNLKTIYATNKTQSTTNNAYGVYDMSGGLWENVASYVNSISTESVNQDIGGYGEEESLLGKNEAEKSKSTAYKTVYEAGSNQINSYNLTENRKGDAIWETSVYAKTAWFNAEIAYPSGDSGFFSRGGCYQNNLGIFTYYFFGGYNKKGPMGQGTTSRTILAF